jgi:ATP-dependent protease ClpP protease subunit
MTYHHYIHGNISSETVQELMDVMNTVILNNSFLKIYINSEGGCISSEYILRDLIESYGHKTELIASGFIGSAAFSLFFMTKKVKKKILPTTEGMCHQVYRDGHILENNKVRQTAHVTASNEVLRKSRTEELLQLIELNEAQLNKFDEGEDIYFTYPDLVKILEKQTVRKKKTV